MSLDYSPTHSQGLSQKRKRPENSAKSGKKKKQKREEAQGEGAQRDNSNETSRENRIQDHISQVSQGDEPKSGQDRAQLYREADDQGRYRAASEVTEANDGPSTCDGPLLSRFLLRLLPIDFENDAATKPSSIVIQRYCDCCQGLALRVLGILEGRLVKLAKELLRVEYHRFNEHHIPVTEVSTERMQALNDTSTLIDFLDLRAFSFPLSGCLAGNYR